MSACTCETLAENLIWRLLHTKYYARTVAQPQSPVVENAFTALVGPFPTADLPICAH